MCPKFRKNTKIPFNSKGFAYIYKDEDFNSKLIKYKFDNNNLEVAHNKIRQGSIIKIINPITNNYITLKNKKKIKYPDFYKVLITGSVAKKLNLDFKTPFVEIYEIKRINLLLPKRQKFTRKKKVSSNAPVEKVKIQNLTNVKKRKLRKKFIYSYSEFYSDNSAKSLKEDHARSNWF